MLRGLYSAASGMIAEQRRHDTINNNIANLLTPGFKGSSLVNRSFPEVLVSLMNGGEGTSSSSIGRMDTGVLTEENPLLFTQGDLQETGNLMDMAIESNIQVPGMTFDASGKYVSPDGQVNYQPQALFTLLNPDGGERYTRNGKFSLNEQGELLAANGYKVLGTDGQPIVIDPQVTNISFTSEGQMIDGQTGQPIADANGQPLSLLVSRIENPNLLLPEGNGSFSLDGNANPASPVTPQDQVQVRQGYIERSNVDPTESMADMMAALRAYEANQKVIQYYDRSLDKAVNEVGRV